MKQSENIEKREQRVIFIIIVLFIINIGDLIATLLYHKIAKGIELNHLADYLFDHVGDTAVVVYKLSLTIFALSVLYVARKLHIAERAAWFLFSIFICLALYWAVFAMMFAGLFPEGLW
tara:strand:- start:2688 stop:3044 length:357 start_codon:yes stop_codon:yes gene_type:complete